MSLTRKLVVLTVALVVAPFVTLPAHAQDPPIGVTEVGNFDGANNYADVWGDGNFAYLGRFGSNRIDIVDISNPEAPVLAATYNTGIGGASAQDVKVAGGLMFIGLEGVSPGAQIVDVRDPFNPVHLTDVTVRSAIHNLFYADGWLYLVDSSTTNVDIVDLRTYNPDTAPAVISTPTYRVTNVGGTFVHDVTVQDGRLYATAWDSLRIYDVSNLANEAPTLIGSASGNSVHAAWATDDGRFVVVAEERTGGGLTLFEMIPNGPGLDVVARDSFVLPSDDALSTHNPLIVGNRVYVSWYEAGVQVLDIDPDTATFHRVAAFDTSALNGNNSFFGGCWGVYPFLGSDRVLASDQSNGLFVLDVDPNLLSFSYPNGQPEVALPDVGTPVETLITELGAPVDPLSVEIEVSIDGGAQQMVAMSDQGGGMFGGDLPAASCGSVIDYSLSAANTNGDLFRDPPAPGDTYRVDVAGLVQTVLVDDFEVDMGWTVTNSNIDTGAWERGDPIGTGPQPEDCFAADGGSLCYFTDQGAPGGAGNAKDVDGGPTRLTSPALDFSMGDGVIRYAYWISNDDGDDSLIVELSDDGGVSWVEARRYTGGNGGWQEDSVPVGEFVTPGSDIRVRFLIADNPNNSLTEAAIDYVRAESFNCEGGGTELTLSATAVVRGQTTTLTAVDALAGETVFFTGSIGGLGLGPCPPALGGLCLDTVDPLQLGTATADGAGTATLNLPVPAGLPASTLWLQAVVLRGAGGADSEASNVVEAPVSDAP